MSACRLAWGLWALAAATVTAEVFFAVQNGAAKALAATGRYSTHCSDSP